jgi:hypothetical protein
LDSELLLLLLLLRFRLLLSSLLLQLLGMFKLATPIPLVALPAQLHSLDGIQLLEIHLEFDLIFYLYQIIII